jgi:hypothetical protein
VEDPAQPAPGPFAAASQLNPAQAEVLGLLGARPGERPEFDAELRHELRAELEARLTPLAEQLPDGQRLFLSKHALSQVHGCERRFLAEQRQPFAWSPPTARGTVTHKAIEYQLHWRGEAAPLELVDEALARLEQGGDGLADWLASCPEGERAELRSGAGELVAKFVECFPPLRRAWRPVTETGLRIELCQGRVVLQGRVDLSLGQAQGTTAGKVLIDLKTGGSRASHLDDLRFYALLDTLRIGTPPRLLATYYLDSGEPWCEAVSADLLRAAALRVAAGADRFAALVHDGEVPRLKAGPGCRWCPVLDDCPEGAAWLAGDPMADE